MMGQPLTACLVAHIPVGDPGKLAVRVFGAGLGRLGQAQVGRLGEQYRVQRTRICDRLARLQVRKVPTHASHLVDFEPTGR